ncbi:hypothetical protein SY88_05790 [Clostridiales bacterium PH28_bin88]|nr:hypothetical protein SY88_05790 [Clostridiales bacterium PH28_bin88]
MKFTPLKFQASLAAGGVALMPFNYLQFAVPHGKGLIKLSDIPWAELTMSQTTLYLPLIGIMLAFTMINLLFTVVFLKSLMQWLANKEEYHSFISNPSTNIGIFAPIASLSMTANVIWGPLGFFIPQLSSNIQVLMLPSLIFFGFLWFMLLRLEFKVLKIWLSQPVDVSKLNFVWLLDVFAFGLVNLTGSGIAAISSNSEIASIATFGSLFTLSIGLFLFITKLAYLIYLQIKSTRLPEKPVLPAYFLVIPITCLFGLSFYRILMYLHTYFSFDVKILSFFLITFSYVITIGWGIFSLYLLSDYLKNDFAKSDFSPPQWGMV